MRVLRLLVVLPVIVVSLAASPAVSAEDDPQGLNNLIGRLLQNVPKKTPTANETSAPGAEDAGSNQTTAAETPPEAKTSGEDDVTASLQQGPLQAVDDAYTVIRSSGPNPLTPDVLDNDRSPSNAVFINSVSEPPHGSVNGEATTYTPDTGFTGTDTFTYSLYEPQTGTSNVATVTITVLPAAVDDAYTVQQDAGPTQFDPWLTANDNIAPFGGAILPSDPPHGTIDTATMTYTPDPGFSGTDTFTYTFLFRAPNEAFIQSNEATVTITVTPTAVQDLTPVAADDAFTVGEDSGQTKLNVLANDTNAAAGALDAPSDPKHGSVTVENGAQPGYLYTPDPGFDGTDTFTYSFTSHADPNAPEKSNTATVTIDVTRQGVVDDGELLTVEADCSGDVTFTNVSDLGLEGTYGDLPSEVDGDFVLAPEDSVSITTGRDELEYRADGPGDQSQEGIIEIPSCSDDDDDDGDDDGDDDDGDDDDGDDDDGDDDGGLPDTGSHVSRLTLAAGITLVAAGASLLNVARFRRRIGL